MEGINIAALVGICMGGFVVINSILLFIIWKLVSQLDYTNRLVLTEKLFSAHGMEGIQALNTIGKMRGITTPLPLQVKEFKKPDAEMTEDGGVVFVQQAR